ncbi:diguanylate cyclase [Pseudolysinimonas sp.]|uniref:sensor domain-containing diguanylate cyclase n=1 Tax=Pseudolysinimonas sp. TaxID=2680009 RepID=UPI003F8105AD
MSDLEAFFDAAPCGLLVTDADDVVLRVNATFSNWTGWPRELILGRPFSSMLAHGSQAFYATQYQDQLFSRSEIREITLILNRLDGTRMPILVNSSAMREDGQVTGVRLAVFDASRRQDFEREMLIARRQAETSEANLRGLQDAASRFLTARTTAGFADQLAAVLQNSFDAFEVMVVAYDEAGHDFDYIRGAEHRELVAEVRRTRGPGAVALAPGESILIHDLEEAYARSERLGDLMRRARASAFAGMPISDGTRTTGAFACLFGRPREFGPAMQQQLVALARQAELGFSAVRLQERLQVLATHDTLTGVANRAAIDEHMSLSLEAAALDGSPTSVIFLDLDGFKRVNDTLGHRAGDLVLQTVADRVKRCIRDGDRVGRYGGDEFVVVCRGAGAAEAAEVASAIGAALLHPIDGLPPELRVTASIGLTTHEAGAATPGTEAVIRRADAAMYDAKRSGTGRVRAR